VTDQTRTAMALLLAHSDVDLGGEIIVHSDFATERAREIRATDCKLGVA
jgi:hypothetical protein